MNDPNVPTLPTWMQKEAEQKKAVVDPHMPILPTWMNETPVPPSFDEHLASLRATRDRMMTELGEINHQISQMNRVKYASVKFDMWHRVPSNAIHALPPHQLAYILWRLTGHDDFLPPGIDYKVCANEGEKPILEHGHRCAFIELHRCTYCRELAINMPQHIDGCAALLRWRQRARSL